MEHRQGIRKPTRREAALFLRGDRVGNAQVTNFSNGGLYLRTRGRRFRPFQLLEIQLSDGNSNAGPQFSVGVVRADEQGIGVLIDGSDGRATPALELLREEPDQVE